MMRKKLLFITSILLMTSLCACNQEKNTSQPDGLIANDAQIQSIESTVPTEPEVILPDLNAEFSSWQEAYRTYIDYLTKKNSDTEKANATYRYSLIHMNDDDIPELYFLSCEDNRGEAVATYYNKHLVTLNLSNTSSADYIEKQGLLYHHPAKAPVSVYELKDGVFSKIASGEYSWDYEQGEKIQPDSQGRPANQYQWEGKEVSEQDFDKNLNAVFDTASGKKPENWYPTDEMLSVLETGANLSANHRYELIVQDVSWTEAQTLCHEKGGYLATVTAPEERQAILELMKQEEKLDIRFFVGYRANETIDNQIAEARWINADGSTAPAGNLPNFWEYQAPDYSFVAPEFEIQECGVLKYYPDTDKIYLFSAPDELVSTLPEYTGTIGYVCEYDN